MKRDPTDPGGEYIIKGNKVYSEDFCAQEGITCSITGEVRDKTITDLVVEVIREREKVGYKTYNKPLLGEDKTMIEWLKEARDECADQLQYLVAAISVLEKELNG